ncbi:MAG: hypothetical protein A2Y38_17330 [Spirochaetes bacterium GWB1_59_5]|nr:MAG: hypothetical protein A2Y38_17330 [Spirochaetes bacterium GWB1_59_5]
MSNGRQFLHNTLVNMVLPRDGELLTDQYGRSQSTVRITFELGQPAAPMLAQLEQFKVNAGCKPCNKRVSVYYAPTEDALLDDACNLANFLRDAVVNEVLPALMRTGCKHLAPPKTPQPVLPNAMHGLVRDVLAALGLRRGDSLARTDQPPLKPSSRANPLDNPFGVAEHTATKTIGLDFTSFALPPQGAAGYDNGEAPPCKASDMVLARSAVRNEAGELEFRPVYSADQYEELGVLAIEQRAGGFTGIMVTRNGMWLYDGVDFVILTDGSLKFSNPISPADFIYAHHTIGGRLVEIERLDLASAEGIERLGGWPYDMPITTKFLELLQPENYSQLAVNSQTKES